jgi:hypothetical protein
MRPVRVAARRPARSAVACAETPPCGTPCSTELTKGDARHDEGGPLGHKILVAAYHVLAKATDYVDLGGAYLDTLNTTRVANQLKRRLERLGYEVALQKVEATPAV